MSVTAIHQPDFMPWLGFFDKISRCDKFVVLDHTMNQPGSTAFRCRRVKFLINGRENWLSIALEKSGSSDVQPINQMRIKPESEKDSEKRLKSIRESYSRAPFFTEIFPLIERYFKSEEMSLLKRNMSFIFEVFGGLGINPEVIYSSGLNCEKSSSELMLEISLKTGASAYLSGDGAHGYLVPDMFKNAGIELMYNNFVHPVYRQFNVSEFVGGLSVIDALMNIGFEGTGNLIRNKHLNITIP